MLLIILCSPSQKKHLIYLVCKLLQIKLEFNKQYLINSLLVKPV